jgi:acetyl esterase/lipase
MATTPSIELETYVYHDRCTVNLDLARGPSMQHISPQKTLIFFHGGGLVSGSRRGRFPPLPVKLLLDRGWAIIVPDYRLLPEASISDMLDDLKHLENWVVQNSTKLGFDAGNVAIGGSSAGNYEKFNYGV